jgi:hypothetical protein
MWLVVGQYLASTTGVHRVLKQASEAAPTNLANSQRLGLTDAGLLRQLAERSKMAAGAQLLMGPTRRRTESAQADLLSTKEGRRGANVQPGRLGRKRLLPLRA